MEENNIVPVFGEMLWRNERETAFFQHSICIWFTGLPASGKTTVAIALENELLKRGFKTVLLDGDNVRSGLNAGLGFSDGDRTENIRRVAEVNKLLLSSGIITINSFVSPSEKIRKLAEDIIGKHDFKLVWVSTPVDVCEKRDVKSHYTKARKGGISSFTGVTSLYEQPADCFVEIPAHLISVGESVEILLKNILPLIEKRG